MPISKTRCPYGSGSPCIQASEDGYCNLPIEPEFYPIDGSCKNIEWAKIKNGKEIMS